MILGKLFLTYSEQEAGQGRAVVNYSPVRLDLCHFLYISDLFFFFRMASDASIVQNHLCNTGVVLKLLDRI
jgi:hypothetical protein